MSENWSVKLEYKALHKVAQTLKHDFKKENNQLVHLMDVYVDG